MNDPDHFVPAWTYNPEDGRGRKGPVSREQAMAELAEVVASIKPDKFEPKVVRQTADYLYAEFQSPTFGFIDDVEVRGGGCRTAARAMQQQCQARIKVTQQAAAVIPAQASSASPEPAAGQIASAHIMLALEAALVRWPTCCLLACTGAAAAASAVLLPSW
jgi:hypothetical protein